MELVGAVTCWLLVGFVCCQTYVALLFVRVLFRRAPASDGGTPCPKAAVILCLRGCDPFLARVLEGLLDQDYNNYDVWIVVDHRKDPAWQVVEETLRSRPKAGVHLRALDEPRRTCSLKCSSLVQAIGELDDSYEVVALIDADTIPHRQWLRQLTAPLVDPQVGAVTGNRWYMPEQISWAVLVRYLWNVGAVVIMSLRHVPWGGTLAVRTEVFRRCDLLDRWANALCEDVPLYRALGDLKLQVAFVPSLIMVNRETCDFKYLLHWIGRQVLFMRLYHPAWLPEMAAGVGGAAIMLGGFAILPAALLTGHGRLAIWASASLACFLGLNIAMLSLIECGVRRHVRRRGEPTAWIQPGAIVRIVAAIPLTQVVYAVTLISAMFVREVEWRGVRYGIDRRGRIDLVEYRPYGLGESGEKSRDSL